MPFPYFESRAVSAILAGGMLALSLQAHAAPSRADAKSLAAAAIQHIQKVGLDQALKDFTEHSADWRKDDMTLIVADLQGTVKAHAVTPQLVGKRLWELKDQNGKLFVQDYVSAAKSGEGWVENDWPNQTTKKIETREMYIKRIPGTDLFVGIGRAKS